MLTDYNLSGPHKNYPFSLFLKQNAFQCIHQKRFVLNIYLDIPKSDILTMLVSPTRQFLAAKSLLDIAICIISPVQN